jgi:carbonic anhydrase
MNRTVTELLSSNDDHAAAYDGRFDDVQDGQRPAAVTVCCSDSRVLQDEMWRNDEPGHLFTCGNIGNRVVQHTDGGPVVSGDVLYPLVHTGTETAIVVGHTGCGAVTATYDALTGSISDVPGITHCIQLLKPTLEPALAQLPDDISRPGAINRLVEYNVDQQLASLQESDAVPAETTLVGVVYDFQNVYGDQRGRAYLINYDGTRDVQTLRDQYPDQAARIKRLWTP